MRGDYEQWGAETMDLGLAGRVALVAASTAGLGFATAEQLVLEGARVAICGRTRTAIPSAVERLTCRATAPEPVAGFVADVTNAAACRGLVERVVGHFGRLDILVTNAGGPPGGKFATTDPAQYQSAVDLLLMSAVHLIQAALPYLRQSDAASILTITSISLKQPVRGLLLSNVFRPAVAGLTKSLSQELGPEGIRVNSILPGWTATQRVNDIMDYRSRANDTTPQSEREKISAAIPLGRMGEPEEFGRAAAFLVSPAASYITGAMIPVDGGSYGGLL